MILQNIILRIYQNIYQRKFSLLIACFCILLNWAGHSFVYENTYRFLTFDMIGTFVAAITLGTAWAIIVAITTPIVLANITSPHFIYLAVINMTGAIFWGWLAETGKLVIINTKTRLKNNLKHYNWDMVSKVLKDYNLNELVRAEDISQEIFIEIYKAIENDI